MPKKPDRKLKRDELAEIMNVDARTLRNWVARGCPCDSNPKTNKKTFNESEVAAWMKQKGLSGQNGVKASNVLADEAAPDIHSARLRKENALARKYETQVDRELGILVEIDAVKSRIGEMVTTAKNRLLGIPAAAAPRCEGQDAPTIQTIIEGLITDALNELSGDH